MADDPISLSASDQTASLNSVATSQPQPAPDLSAPASESASTQSEAATPLDQPTIPASVSTPEQRAVAREAPPVSEPPQAPQMPVDESVSMPTSPPTDPPRNTPTAQDMPPETEPTKTENQPMQADTEPQKGSEAEAVLPQSQETLSPPSAPPAPSIPSLHFPFYGDFPVTFDFGAQPTDENIKKKYQEWGIVGHNGLDFGLPEGTEVLACDEGTVIQAGDNGDHGISVTIKHSWGTSVYCHLQSFGVLVNDHITKPQVIGLSGRTGF